MIEWLAVLLRALSFIALFQAAGAAVFLTLFGTRLPVVAAPIARRARIAAIAAATLVLAQFSLEAARMGGDFSSVFDSQMQRLAWESASGTALVFRVAGLLLLMAGLSTALKSCGPRGRFAAGTFCILGVLLLVAAFASVGHTVDHPHRAVLAALLAIHLCSVTFWFGAIGPLRQAVTLEPPAMAAAALERFSRIALWMVPALLLAGSGLALLLLPGFSVFTQPYGQLLLAKIVGFSVLLGFGALNKLRLTPALRQNPASAAPRLRRSLASEYGILCTVLAITAVMSGLYSPD
jgi:copper resistance protein D